MINSKDVEKEILNRAEFLQKVISYRSVINFKFESLHSNENIASVKIHYVLVMLLSRTNKVKFPKFQISKIFLDQINFENCEINLKSTRSLEI